MNRRSIAVSAALITTALWVGCAAEEESLPTEPAAEALTQETLRGQRQLVDPIGGESEPSGWTPMPHSPHMVEYADDAPPLGNYLVGGWYEIGEKTELEIDFDMGGGEHEDFVEVEFPSSGQVRLADGTPLQEGVMVWVELTINPNTMSLSLSPEGLRFDPEHPAKIKIDYSYADHDFNSDGIVDGSDEEIRLNQLDVWRNIAPGFPWTQTNSEHDSDDEEFDATIIRLENIAVSW